VELGTVAAWITGIGAVLSAGAGVAMIWREVKSRQHKEIKRLDEELSNTQEQVVALHKETYRLKSTLADHGIDVDEPE
jgi:ABC-type nickel/cobalt efflux system permease component RcnA